MHGSRQLALDFIKPYLKPGLRVLDVCCGGAWLMEHVHAAGGVYFGIDKRAKNCEVTERHDVTQIPWIVGQFDLAISVYGMQHLLGDEAIAWREARRHAKRMIVVARYDVETKREMNREDPLNGYSHSSLSGLALATGWSVKEFKGVTYNENGYYSPPNENHLRTLNAFVAYLEEIE